ncbi:hypothetical protein [Subtercola sp. RTI3]|nr:hypothetical protein [Subtercola sp. RTI3]
MVRFGVSDMLATVRYVTVRKDRTRVSVVFDFARSEVSEDYFGIYDIEEVRRVA